MALTQKVAYRKGQKVTADVINDTVNTAVDSYAEARKAVEIAKQADAVAKGAQNCTLDAQKNSAQAMSDAANALRRSQKAIDDVNAFLESKAQGLPVYVASNLSKGDKGDTPVVSAEAHVDCNYGAPEVEVQKQDTADGAKFIFYFKNIKGDKGESPLEFSFDNGVLTIVEK